MSGAKGGAGALTDRLIIQTTTPVAISVSSITRSSSTATVTTATAHGFVTGDYVTHAGATQTEYNVEAQITKTGANTYTFTVSGTPTTPATGTITATFTSDSSGGQGTGFYTLATVWGQVMPLSASERLQVQAIGSQQAYRARIYYRADVTPKMRLTWTPYLNATAKTLEIHGVLPDANEPRRFIILDLGEVI